VEDLGGDSSAWKAAARGEKAEGDLAAARAALVAVLDWTGSDDRDYPEHAAAIAAARGGKARPVTDAEMQADCWVSDVCPTCGKVGDPACTTVGCPDVCPTEADAIRESNYLEATGYVRKIIAMSRMRRGGSDE
jgi:hypothetical protein